MPPTNAAVYYFLRHVEQATDVVDLSAVRVWCLSLAARWWTWVTPPTKPGCRSTSPSWLLGVAVLRKEYLPGTGPR